ncbi:PAS domain-containing sensor histidine kinase, partial [Vibrio sp. D173a]|uniref:sensor histidine kinase n=1 Tax=Vibrio sp. D173a TaxID=2836349 RepID=UPI0025605AD1|nr:PAS domain-containing sensor histidine kinase [Vibrio sp. D173a]
LVGEKWFSVIQSAFDPKDDDGHEISLKNGRKVRLAISASATGQLILITDLTEPRLLQARVSDLQRLSSLVNDMLLFAKGGANKVVKPFTVSELIAEYQPMVETALKTNSIDYCQEVEGEETQMFGNANAIASALSNLVLNAV